MLFNRCIVYLKYSCTKKRAKNVQKRASQVLIHQKRASQVLIYQKNVQKRAKMCKNVHLKYFWTQFKSVHQRGPCSLRPCILRPYCITKVVQQVSFYRNSSPQDLYTMTWLGLVAYLSFSLSFFFCPGLGR